jgi:DNA-binding NarL/FixJ family response regulator
VKKHLARIYDKLGVANRTAAAFYGDRFFTAEE